MSYNEENIYDFEQEHDHEHEHEMPASDKYTEALNKYNTALKDDEVTYATENILNKYLSENKSGIVVFDDFDALLDSSSLIRSKNIDVP